MREALETSCRRAFRALVASMMVALLVNVAGAAALNDDPSVKTADGIVVYLGVMPAAIIRGHPREHPEAQMHGGPRSSAERHIVIALFDAKTFERLVDADVSATVEGLGHVGRVSKELEPMEIAETVTFGGYFPFQGTDNYKIQIEIKPAGRDKMTIVTFDYGV